MENTIEINGTIYTVRKGMKAILAFEAITEKPFEIKTTIDMVVYMYAAILTGTPDAKLTLDQFVEALDMVPDLIKRLTEIVLQPSAMEQVVQLSNEGGTEPKKG